MGLSSQLAPSAIARPGVCTSSTRPASPYEGQYIHETDTDKLLFWNGSAWYPNWNVAWGQIAISELADGTTKTGNPSTITSITFTHVANRKVLIQAFGRLNFTATASAGELRDGTTRLTYWDQPSAGFHNMVNQIVVASSASSKTYDFRLYQGTTATITVQNNFTLLATDIGPA